ncbi:unnamed protein product, partial [Medioppia subpectinata]
MSAVVLSPEKRVYVSIKPYNQLKSPKICLSLDSSDETIDGKEGHNGCQSCPVLKRMVVHKDTAIRRLSEDREQLKLKLTQINNQNIELKQTLKRLQSQDSGSAAIESNEKYVTLKASNDELVAIN